MCSNEYSFTVKTHHKLKIHWTAYVLQTSHSTLSHHCPAEEKLMRSGNSVVTQVTYSVLM